MLKTVKIKYILHLTLCTKRLIMFLPINYLLRVFLMSAKHITAVSRRMVLQCCLWLARNVWGWTSWASVAFQKEPLHKTGGKWEPVATWSSPWADLEQGWLWSQALSRNFSSEGTNSPKSQFYQAIPCHISWYPAPFLCPLYGILSQHIQKCIFFTKKVLNPKAVESTGWMTLSSMCFMPHFIVTVWFAWRKEKGGKDVTTSYASFNPSIFNRP